jgi:5-formyltetrahydrofolate cyclo-ligase
MKRMRREHPQKERRQKSEKIAAMLVESSAFQGAKTILFYCPREDEVDALFAIPVAIAQKKTVCFPRTDKKAGAITAHEVVGLGSLQKGAFGIMEPVKDARKIEPKKIDLAIVPGVAFDLHGDRIGHGVGYYDKFLSTAKGARKVGLAFDFQVVGQKIVCEAHDVQVDEIITEKRHIVVRKS